MASFQTHPPALTSRDAPPRLMRSGEVDCCLMAVELLAGAEASLCLGFFVCKSAIERRGACFTDLIRVTNSRLSKMRSSSTSPHEACARKADKDPHAYCVRLARVSAILLSLKLSSQYLRRERGCAPLWRLAERTSGTIFGQGTSTPLEPFILSLLSIWRCCRKARNKDIETQASLPERICLGLSVARRLVR